MSKHVLIVSASPRKGGNSDLLCDQFTQGVLESKNQVEKIFLKDKDINYCTGCGACYKKEASCPQKDDMGEILEKMIEADVIVLQLQFIFIL